MRERRGKEASERFARGSVGASLSLSFFLVATGRGGVRKGSNEFN